MGCSHAVPRVRQVLFMGHTSRTAIDHNFRDECQPELREFWPALVDVFKVPTEAEPAAESAGTLAGVGPGLMPIALNRRRAPRLSSSPRMYRHPPTHKLFLPPPSSAPQRPGSGRMTSWIHASSESTRRGFAVRCGTGEPVAVDNLDFAVPVH